MKTETTYLRMKSMLMLLMVLCLSITAMADVKMTFSYEGLYYEVDEFNHATVIAPPSGKYSGDIKIPPYAIYNDKSYQVLIIGDNAFKGATDVTSVTLPVSSITKIGEYAFNDCTGLTEFTLPNGIKSIGKCAFYYCDKLQDIYSYSTDLTKLTVALDAFSKIKNGGNVCTLHVPEGCTAAYTANESFKDFTIVDDAFPPVIYQLYVGEEQVNSNIASDILGDGTVSYDAAKNTLTIKGDIKSDIINLKLIRNWEPNLTIEVAKPATLTAANTVIYTTKDITITGSSLLKVHSPKDVPAINTNKKNLTIVDANLEIEGGISGYFQNNNTLTVTNSSVKIESTYDGGVISEFENLTLNDCYIRNPYVWSYDKCSKYSNMYCLMTDEGDPVQSVEIRAGDPPTLYDLYVLDERVTSENASDILGDGAASYEVGTNTLTVKGDITSNDVNLPCITNSGMSDLTIRVNAPATLSAAGSAILIDKNTKITGSSLLKISSPKDQVAIKAMNTYLDIVNANLEVEGCVAVEGNGYTLSFTNSSVKVETTNANGAIYDWYTPSLSECYIRKPVGGSYGEAINNGNKKCVLDEFGNVAKSVEIHLGEAPTLYNLHVAGERVTSENASDILGDGAASYKEDNNTLTIKGNITAPDAKTPCVKISNSSLNIEVAAPATLSATDKAISSDEYIYISGSSKLTVSISSKDNNAAAIYAKGGGIDNAYLSVVGPLVCTNGDFYITNSTVSVTDGVIAGNAGELYISNSTVTASAGGDLSAILGWSLFTLNGCDLKTPQGGGYDTGDKRLEDAEGKVAKTVEIVPTKLPHELAFSETMATVKMGEEFTLPILLNPNILNVTWSSSDKNVATVNATTGEVTLVAAGQTTITATFEGDNTYQAGSASYVLMVNKKDPAPNELALSETEATVKIDEVFTPPTLSNPNSLTVTWKSSDENVATVNASTGEVTLVAPGQTTITATFAGNDDFEAGSVSYTLYVNHKDAAANGLAFSETEVMVKIGKTFTLPTLANPNKLAVTWKSSDETVATVNQKGEVTLVAAGATNISVTFDGNLDFEAGSVSYMLIVEGKDPLPNELAFSKTEVTAKIDKPFTPPTLINPNNLVVTWTSNNEAVATVNASTGEVTFVAPGSTVISATFDGNVDFYYGVVSYTLIVISQDDQLKGDANNDGIVDEDDIVAVVNYILKGTKEGLSLENADVNSDGKIDATDIVLIVDIIK